MQIKLIAQRSIVVCDFDDTLAATNASIKIVNKKDRSVVVALNTSDFAKHRSKYHHENYLVDLSDFNDPKKVFATITNAQPLITNLQRYIDEAVNRQIPIAILTARSNLAVSFAAIKHFLMYRDKDGVLNPIGRRLSKKNFFAVNDPQVQAELKNKFNLADVSTQNLKAVVLRDILARKYKHIYYVDDDENNLEFARKVALEMPKGVQLFVISAAE